MKTYFSLKSILNNDPPEDKNKALSPRDMLLADIAKTQHALEVAYCGFDYTTDPDLIDCYIYEVNSALKRYRFLLNQAQRMELFLEEERSLHQQTHIVKEAPSMRGSLSLHHN